MSGGQVWQSEDFEFNPRAITAARKSEEPSAELKERKKRRRFLSGACQVPGCENALQLQYHKKYHVCREHFTAPCTVLDGVNSRFCQKCGRFQPTDAFDNDKRTCRVALAMHNARRRKREHTSKDTCRSGATGSGATGSAEAAAAVVSGSSDSGQAERSNAGGGSRGSGSGATASLPTAATPASGAAGQAAGAEAVSAALPNAGPSAKRQHLDRRQAAAAAVSGRHSGSTKPPQQEQREQQQQQPAASPNQSVFQQVQHIAQQAQQGQQAQQVLAQRQPAVLPFLAEATGLFRRPSGELGQLLAGISGAAVPAVVVKTEQAHHTDPSSTSSGMQLTMLPSGHASWQPSNGTGQGGVGVPPAGVPADLLTFTTASAFTAASSGSGSAGVANPLAAEAIGALSPPPPMPAVCAPLTHVELPISCDGLPASFGALSDLLGGQDGLHLLAGLTAGPTGLPALPSRHRQQAQQAVHVTASSAPGAFGPAGDASAGFAPAPAWGALQMGSEGLASHLFHLEHSAPQPQPSLLQHLEPDAVRRTAASGSAAAGPGYMSPAHMHRMSIKIFQCTPDELAPSVRAELESVLNVAPKLVDSYVRPGCTHLTVDLLLGPEEGSVVAGGAAPAALLSALRASGALGPATGKAVILQWQGRLAAACGQAVATVAAAPPPRLTVRPACLAMPAPGQPWPLLQLQLDPLPEEGWDLGAITVLCRQAGCHLPVTVWGSDEAEAQAASAACQARPVPSRSPTASLPYSGSDGGSSSSDVSGDEGCSSGASSDDDVDDDADSAYESHQEGVGTRGLPGGAGAPKSSGHGSSLWVRPVGLRPGSCEVELELRGGAGAACRAPVVLSVPAPVLVLREAEVAAEVAALLSASGCPGLSQMDDLLRDIGLAAAFIEEVWAAAQPAGGAAARAPRCRPLPPAPPLPPTVVAAAAAAAAAFAQRQRMPALERLLRQAHSAAVAAAAAAAPPPLGEPSTPLGELVPANASYTALDVQDGAAGKAAAVDSWLASQHPSKGYGDALSDREAGAPVKSSFSACEPARHSSYAALKAEGMLRDVQELASGAGLHLGSRAGSGCLPSFCATSPQGLTAPRLLRVCCALGAFYCAVILSRVVPAVWGH